MTPTVDAQGTEVDLHQRQRAYQLCFGSVAGQAVLNDLAKFCRANTSTFDPDPRVHAVLEGRREVWLRIEEHMLLTMEQLFALKTGRTLQLNIDEGETE